MTWESLLSQVQAWPEARNLFVPGAGWVIGVSGGPDSTLLLHAFKDLSTRAELGWRLHVAHYHHDLRGAEADEDAAFVAATAEELGLPFSSEHGDIRGRVEREGGSTEEVARMSRYDFLERTALRTDSDLVAVAHHADDNAETVLHRICRGTGLRGLVGIHDVRPIQPASRIRLVRPFLNLRRAQIEEMCQARGLKIRTDSTNRAPEFTRGRIRHQVMPLLAEQLNPNVAEALLRLAEHARWLGSYLEDAAARTFESLVISQDGRHVVLNTKALLSKQKLIQAEVVRRAITLVCAGEQDLSLSHVEAILKLAEESGSGKEVHVPGPVVVRKQYDRLEFEPLAPAQPQPELGTVFVACPGRTPLPTLGLALSVEVCPVDPAKIDTLLSNLDEHEEWVDFDQVRPPLYVRGRRDGDRFHPLGAPGAKTIGDFLSDEKMEPQLRQRTGLLCDQEGPLWVMPLRIDERAKLRPSTRRALRLTLTPLSPLPTAST